MGLTDKIIATLGWRPWYREFPVAPGKTTSCYRIDILYPYHRAILEVKQPELWNQAEDQVDRYAKQMLGRNLAGPWMGIISDGNEWLSRLYQDGEPLVRWRMTYVEKIRQQVLKGWGPQDLDWDFLAGGWSHLIINGLQSKQCRGCNNVLPIQRFQQIKNRLHTYKPQCYTCSSKNVREYRQSKGKRVYLNSLRGTDWENANLAEQPEAPNIGDPAQTTHHGPDGAHQKNC